ncbi:9471_t:CDS:1, partial [Acaulospora morrowiae]
VTSEIDSESNFGHMSSEDTKDKVIVFAKESITEPIDTVKEFNDQSIVESDAYREEADVIIDDNGEISKPLDETENLIASFSNNSSNTNTLSTNSASTSASTTTTTSATDTPLSSRASSSPSTPQPRPPPSSPIIDSNVLQSSSLILPLSPAPTTPPQSFLRSIPPTPTTPYFPALTSYSSEDSNPPSPEFPPETTYGTYGSTTPQLIPQSLLELEPENPYLVPLTPNSYSNTYISPSTPLP